MYTCPVCGFNQLIHPPENETICPSCYTEFGYDDATKTHAELRAEWLANGAHWEGANVTPPPPGWNPYTQLSNLRVAESATEATQVTHARVHWQGHIVQPNDARIFNFRIEQFVNLNDVIAFQVMRG